MRSFMIPRSALEKIIDRASRKRYAISGEEFVALVKTGKARFTYPDCDDLAELSRLLD